MKFVDDDDDDDDFTHSWTLQLYCTQQSRQPNLQTQICVHIQQVCRRSVNRPGYGHTINNLKNYTSDSPLVYGLIIAQI